MGVLVNTLFTILFGWTRDVARSLWNLLTPGQTDGALRWLSDNWLLLATILCIIGTAVDFIVHMLRWRPLEVWASFFRRISARRKSAEDHQKNVQTEDDLPDPKSLRIDRNRHRTQNRRGNSIGNSFGKDPAGQETDERLTQRIRNRFSDKLLPTDEDKIVYTPAPTNPNQRHSYNEPVYPPDWSDPGKGGTER